MKTYARTNLVWGAKLGAVVVLLICALQVAGSTPRPQDSSPKIITMSLPDATVGKDYFKVIEARGGKLPWDFKVAGQPKGLSLDTVRGPNTSDTLHGIPMEAGDFDVTLTVSDQSDPPQTSSTKLKLHVKAN